MSAESNPTSYGMNNPLKLLAYIYCRKLLDQTLTHNYSSSSSYLLMWNRGKLLGSPVEVKLSSKATVLTKMSSATVLRLTVWFLCPFPAELSTPTVFNTALQPKVALSPLALWLFRQTASNV